MKNRSCVRYCSAMIALERLPGAHSSRPYSRLSGTQHDGQAAPQSEVELLNVWWARGGYDSDEQRLYQRQRALIQLAKAGAVDLGGASDWKGSTPRNRRSAPRQYRKGRIAGHTVQFVHDIFFEWAFLHLLIDRDAEWLDEIRAVGEPPVLGRAVELFSQATLAQQGIGNRNSRPSRTPG